PETRMRGNLLVRQHRANPRQSDRQVKPAKRRERGQGLVEFALILPIFLTLILATVDFGWALRAYVVEANATREGARYWAINGAPSGGCADVLSAVTTKAPTLSGLTATYKIGSATTTTCT